MKNEKMKNEKMKIKILILLCMVPLYSFAQSSPWLWAKRAGGTDLDCGYSAISDVNGNTYATGIFQSPTISFGPITLTNSGVSNIFIVKYDASGNVIWAKRAGGNSDDRAMSIAADSAGNVYVTGWFGSHQIVFGSDTLTTTGPYIACDMFVVKYDTNGNVLWAKSAGGTFTDYGKSVAIDALGNVYVAGAFTSSSITFGPNTFINANSNNNFTATADIFFLKYDVNGNLLWAKTMGGASNDWAHSVTTDGMGKSLIAGRFGSSIINFGAITLSNADNTGQHDDMFIAKYNTTGNELWAKNAGGTSDDVTYSITADVNSNIYAVGYFQSPTITFGTTTLTKNGVDKDIFIVKYGSGGNVLWAKSAGGADQDLANCVIVDALGNSYVVGNFLSDSVTFGTTILANEGIYSDVFVVKYDATGNIVWAQSAGGADDDQVSSVGIDASGDICITGYFISPFITFESITLTDVGAYDFFIAKLSSVTGLIEDNSENNIMVFPNPSNGVFNVFANENKQCPKIEIYNLLGKKIYQSETKNWKSEIDLSKQPNGIYFISIETDKRVAVQKLIIQQ